MALKQCVNPLIFWPENTDLKEFFQECRAIGYQAFEVFSPDKLKGFRGMKGIEEIVSVADEAGLVPASMVGHNSLEDGLNNPENHDRIEAELRQSITMAAGLGIRGLICFSGNRVPGQSDEEGLRQCAIGLRRVAGLAEEKGVNLNMELLNSKVNHTGFLLDRTALGVALCEMVGSPRVKLLYDIYHMQIMEGDILRNMEQYIDFIGHIHTAGNPGRKDLDDHQELNYRAIGKAVDGLSYDGYFGHEFWPRGDKMEALRTAFAVCAGQTKSES